jgi:hypothetical protein
MVGGKEVKKEQSSNHRILVTDLESAFQLHIHHLVARRSLCINNVVSRNRYGTFEMKLCYFVVELHDHHVPKTYQRDLRTHSIYSKPLSEECCKKHGSGDVMTNRVTPAA